MNIFQWGETRGYKVSDSQYKNYISYINFNNTTFLPVIVIVMTIQKNLQYDDKNMNTTEHILKTT